MSAFLEAIVAARRRRVEAMKAQEPAGLPTPEGATFPPPDPVPALRATGGFLIAEFKRASPSKGPIAPEADPSARARAYERAGAAAVSVVAEPDFFMGSREDVRSVSHAVSVPVLCKDFILDPVQLHAAKADGARWVLLIARVLGPELGSMAQRAFSLGLEPLVEVHAEGELDEAIASGARLIGVNARDLDTFQVDLGVVERLAPRCPASSVCIAESGLSAAEDLLRLRDAGAHGFLIGETLMRSGDPESALRALAGILNPSAGERSA